MRPVSTYRAALYVRLSKDDEGASESASISTQRKMLRNYAQENGFVVYDEYIDDGWSGTNFERPDFRRMVQDIESRKVNLVITKDLSRLGRDYIATGQYTEIYFPSKGVRYIAINDGYDSDSPYTDIAPFKNVVNEMYARDISRKIRSAFATKMRDGSYIGNFAPYGYKKDPINKNHLIPDEKTSLIVQEVFQMAAEGGKPVEIARHLNSRGVPPPSVYRRSRHPQLGAEHRSKRSEWTSGAVTKLLANIVYLGHMAQGKTTKVSFKSRTTIRNPRRDWIVVMNTHEPIIDQDTFDMARRRTQCRTCKKEGTFFNVFSGIAKCADCGRNMSTVSTRKKGSPADLACGGYKLRGSRECSNHFIDYNHLCRIVLDTVSEHTDEHELSQDLLFRLIDRIEVGQGSYARMEQGRVKRQTIRIHVRFPSQNSVKECVI
jgi:site-specific DNA recombinase